MNGDINKTRDITGFSLIEIAIVLVVAGFLMAGGAAVYSTYMQDRQMAETVEKQRDVRDILNAFQTAYGRLPCPANPTLRFGEDGYGEEDCSLMTSGAATGSCTDGSLGVCKISGQRDTNADDDSSDDPVLTGAIPFATLRESSDILNVDFNDISFTKTVDPWDYQMTYAVSGLLTNNATYQSEYGTIAIETENGDSLTIPEDSGHFVVFSHGKNHAGAYNLTGQRPTSCRGGLNETENCDGDSVFVHSIYSIGDNSDYYDDAITYTYYSPTRLWEFVPGTKDIYSKNIGNVGIGTTTPQEKLHVEVDWSGNFYGNVVAPTMIFDEVCNTEGEDCWSPLVLADPDGGIECTGSAPAGYEKVVERIENGNVVCTDIELPNVSVSQTCPVAGEYVVGFDSSGDVICDTP